jgi:hypothetical protein
MNQQAQQLLELEQSAAAAALLRKLRNDDVPTATRDTARKMFHDELLRQRASFRVFLHKLLAPIQSG